MKKVIVFLADGLEECEALLTVDILRRAGCLVTTASVTGKKEITSSHNVTFMADTLAETVDFEEADMIFLPGGMPGTENLGKSSIVKEQCRIFAESKLVAAICAAPSVLASLGLLEGKRATCHPSFENKMAGAVTRGEQVEVSGNIITGRALGASVQFSLELVKILEGEAAAETVKKAICDVS